jgi:hypothetical protein
MPGSTKWSPPSNFSNQNLVCISHVGVTWDWYEPKSANNFCYRLQYQILSKSVQYFWRLNMWTNTTSTICVYFTLFIQKMLKIYINRISSFQFAGMCRYWE